MSDRHKLERQLARASLLHHRKREEELERRLADFLALAVSHKCRCQACRALRAFAAELA